MISNGTFHDLFSSGYLKTVWSHVARTKVRALIASVPLVSSLGVAAEAQTATATPESEEIIRLREQKTRAELEKDIAITEKAKRDAEFPKSSTASLSGETEINDGAVFESDMVSYFSMAYAADDLVKGLKTLKLLFAGWQSTASPTSICCLTTTSRPARSSSYASNTASCSTRIPSGVPLR